MAKTWWAITVELVEGRGEKLWPRPGRMFAVAPSHTFAEFADAIDTAFGRWDRSHLREFRRAEARIGMPDEDDDWDEDDELLDVSVTKLSDLVAGERFLYVFDFGDDWQHLCTVDDAKIDPLDTLGIKPRLPLPYFGWGDLPDQYGRRWAEDDGDGPPPPPDPKGSDLPTF